MHASLSKRIHKCESLLRIRKNPNQITNSCCRSYFLFKFLLTSAAYAADYFFALRLANHNGNAFRAKGAFGTKKFYDAEHR